MYCNNCGNEYTEADKFCSKCGKDLLNNTYVPKYKKIEDKPNIKDKDQKKGIGCGTLNLILIIGFFVFVWLYTSLNSSDNGGDSSSIQSDSTMQSEAKYYCNNTVKANLKNPNGATFPSFEEYNFTNLGNNTYKVKSYVDGTNSFGAIIRTNFECKVKVFNDGGQVIGLTMDN